MGCDARSCGTRHPAAGSPAGNAGLRRGDLIQEVNRTPVSSLKEYNKVMKSIDDDESFLLLIKRGNNTFYAVVNVE